MRGLVDAADAGAYVLGFLRCQNTSLTAFRSSIVARCHAMLRNLAMASPFSIMMAMTATFVFFQPAARAAAWVAEMAVFTSAALLLISNLLPPICLSTQVKLVMASLSFQVVLVCGCAHHATLIRRAGWIIQHRGKLFSNRSGNRSGASGCVFGHVGDDRRF